MNYKVMLSNKIKIMSLELTINGIPCSNRDHFVIIIIIILSDRLILHSILDYNENLQFFSCFNTKI